MHSDVPHTALAFCCFGVLGLITFPALAANSLSRDCLVASSWTNKPFEPQTGTFTAEFDARPFANDIDGVIGLSSENAIGYTNLAVIVRFFTNGVIDARNGGTYAAASTIPYSANLTYHFRLVVNVSHHTYSIYVAPTTARK